MGKPEPSDWDVGKSIEALSLFALELVKEDYPQAKEKEVKRLATVYLTRALSNVQEE